MTRLRSEGSPRRKFRDRRPHYITYRDSSTAEQLVTRLLPKRVKEFYSAAVAVNFSSFIASTTSTRLSLHQSKNTETPPLLCIFTRT